MRLLVAIVLFGLSGTSARAESYLDQLDQARPAAAALIEQTAGEWVAAPRIVKDASGFKLFQRRFPRKKSMSQDDMIACIDKRAATAAPATAVMALFNACAGL